MSVMLHLCFYVNGSVCFVCWVFDSVIWLLNVMELLSVVEGDLLNRPCMVLHIMRVLCLWSQ